MNFIKKINKKFKYNQKNYGGLGRGIITTVRVTEFEETLFNI